MSDWHNIYAIFSQGSKASSPAGCLQPKHRAPTCAICGKALWVRDYLRQFSVDREPLGYLPSLRVVDGKPVCWNAKACAKRKLAGADR